MSERKVILVMFLLGIVILGFVYINYPVDAQCFGFFKEGICYNIGDELRVDGEYFFVNSNGELEKQRSTGSSCDNNFECLENLCSYNICVNLFEEVQENTKLLEEIEQQDLGFGQKYDLTILVATNKEEYSMGEVIKLR